MILETLSVYTRENLKAYKSLHAYKFLISGHVQDVILYNYNIVNKIEQKLASVRYASDRW